MLKWSREQFEEDSRRLALAFESLSSHRSDDDDDDDDVGFDENDSLAKFWSDWQLESSSSSNNNDNNDQIVGNELYWIHPPVRRSINRQANVAGGSQDVLDDDEENFLYCDDSIIQDLPEEIALPPTKIDKNHNQNKNSTTISTEWHLSIVYHAIWRTPVLYFHVQDLERNGSPLSRHEILPFLLQANKNANSLEDTWDFVSYDEHPITRTPSFFLHPCQTTARLQLLVKTTKADNNKNDSHIDNNQKQDDLLLLSWMAMILPSIGYPMPSKVFLQVKKLLELSHER